MAIKTSKLEARLACVEKELAELKAHVVGEKKTPWWQQIEGGFEGDPVFAEIVRLGDEIRKKDRKARR